MEGGGEGDEDGEEDDNQEYGVDGEKMDGVCGLNTASKPCTRTDVTSTAAPPSTKCSLENV